MPPSPQAPPRPPPCGLRWPAPARCAAATAAASRRRRHRARYIRAGPPSARACPASISEGLLSLATPLAASSPGLRPLSSLRPLRYASSLRLFAAPLRYASSARLGLAPTDPLPRQGYGTAGSRTLAGAGDERSNHSLRQTVRAASPGARPRACPLPRKRATRIKIIQ